MTKDKNIDATFSIENEDLGNWVVSLMEEFIENDDLTHREQEIPLFYKWGMNCD